MKNNLSIAEIAKIIEPLIANHEKGKEILEYLQYLSNVENEIKIDFGTLFRILKSKNTEEEPLYVDCEKAADSFLFNLACLSKEEEGTTIFPYIHFPQLVYFGTDKDGNDKGWRLSICSNSVFLNTKDYGDVFSLDKNDLLKEKK